MEGITLDNIWAVVAWVAAAIVLLSNAAEKIAKAVQAAIHTAVEELTGVTIAAVNVNVCGIVRQ